MATLEIKVPDIGDFKDVPVIEILVKAGDPVKKEASLVTLESDKATMEVPSTHAGIVKEVKVKLGDKVSEGTVIAVLESADAAQAAPQPAAAAPPPAAPAAKAPAAAQPSLREALTSTLASLDADLHAEVLVLGAGPGGYTAAFRAADLGKKVVLVERYATLGGVCLNVGCIPSKALLHAAKVIADAEDMAHHGVTFGKPAIDLDGVRKFKDGVVSKLTKGLASLAKARKVTVVEGRAQFASPHTLEVRDEGRAQGRLLRPLHHRRGLAVGEDPGLPLRRPAPHGLHGRARAEGRPEAPADHRGRHHRPRDGDRLRRARLEGDGGRVHGPPHPRGGPRHREAAREAHREALREDPAQDEGREDRGPEGGPSRHLRERRRRLARPGAGSLRPRAPRGGPAAEREEHRRREGGRGGERPRLDPRGQPDAHQRRRTSTPSATSWASPCWRTRRRTRASSPPR